MQHPASCSCIQRAKAAALQYTYLQRLRHGTDGDVPAPVTRNAPMDSGHLLQDCPLQVIPRLAAWPEETPSWEIDRSLLFKAQSEISWTATLRPLKKTAYVVRASNLRGRLEEAIEEERGEEDLGAFLCVAAVPLPDPIATR